MDDRIVISLFLLLFALSGVVSILKPEFAYRTTATNTLKKKPSKSDIKRYIIGGYISVSVCLILIIIVLLGGLKGI